VTVRKKRGVVLEIIGSDMVLLTPEGEFVKRPVLDSSVVLGQEFHYCETVEVINPPKQGFLTKWRRSGLAVAAVFLMLILTPTMLNMLSMTTETVAYVTIDVNPSIELAIDNKGAVVSAEGLNDDGRRVLQSIELVGLVGLKSEIAASRIVKELVEFGYIKRGDAATLMITVRSVKSGNQVALGLKEKLTVATKETLAQNEVKYAVVEAHMINEELRLSAEQTGVSPGKYLFMLQERKLELAVVPELIQVHDNKPGNISITGADAEEAITIAPKAGADSKDIIEVAKAPVTPKSTNQNNETNKKNQDELDEQTIIAMLIVQLEANNLEKLYELAFLYELDAEKLEKLIADKDNLLKQPLKPEGVILDEEVIEIK